jgi:23S rRNA pseudouridine1911/1915/1917 synthase
LAALRFRVSDDQAGRRLDSVLAGTSEIGSRAAAERLVAEGAVRVDGASRPKSHRLAAGERVEVELPAPSDPRPEEMDLPVVWADEHLLVVDKPAGLVVHPAAGTKGTTLVPGLLALGASGGEAERPGIVHRLDRDTSGLLLVARSQRAHTALQRLIRRREVERRYLALVSGTPRSRTGRIEAPIGRHRHDRTRHSLDTDTPRDAVTWFELQELLGPRALLELRLETGRTHQIRVHLDAIGLPVCGDPVYGVRDLDLDRQFLHAHRLRLRHPLTGEELDLESPLPEDLTEALLRARAARDRPRSAPPTPADRG